MDRDDVHSAGPDGPFGILPFASLSLPDGREYRRGVRRERFDSSAIASAGYDDEASTLEVEFASGGIYCYRLVPARVWRELRAAPSAGRYFAERIRDVYPEEWLPHAR